MNKLAVIAAVVAAPSLLRAANWNGFVPELEALYDRIEFLKP